MVPYRTGTWCTEVAQGSNELSAVLLLEAKAADSPITTERILVQCQYRSKKQF